MAFKIERKGNGYRITSPGDSVARLRVDARDLHEVHHALDHYYGAGHAAHPPLLGNCPICRSIEKGRK